MTHLIQKLAQILRSLDLLCFSNFSIEKVTCVYIHIYSTNVLSDMYVSRTYLSMIFTKEKG